MKTNENDARLWRAGAQRLRQLRFFSTAALAALLLSPASARALVADSADDVCSANANPCNVSEVVDVVPGSVLDFGTRSLNVTGSGQFNFGAGNGSVLSGPFSASVSGTAVNAKGSLAGGGTSSGIVLIEARRRCSAGETPPACTGLADCQLGACDTRRCSLRSTRTCTSDESCDIGPCGLNKRCAGSASLVRCDTNADCDFGNCPEQLTCTNRGENPELCSSNADCDFGQCSVGTASITMNGQILGNSDSPAIVTLRAADSIAISKLVNVSSTAADADGGELTAHAENGNVSVTAKINATGGGASQGGVVDLRAGNDILLNEEINVTGGDFDGGSVETDAGRDVVVTRSIFANSNVGAGFGGEILFYAGRDLSVSGASVSNKTVIETNGHTNAESFAGDGGTQDYTSLRHLTLGAFTRLAGLGSQPDGIGSDVFLEAGGTLTTSGEIAAKALGLKGGGGSVSAISGGATEVPASGSYDITGGEDGGGSFDIDAGGALSFAGSADVAAGSGGAGGTIFADSNATATMSGLFHTGGSAPGNMDLEACRITLQSGGTFDNDATGGQNRLTARESMRLLAGSVMTTAGGPNVLRYRTQAKPPVVSGTVIPAPTLVVEPSLVGCPVCGNLEVDDGESCDDGNLNNGDGCSSLCQNENCLAQTVEPGYPDVALCEDGNLCTTDVCNTAVGGGTCQHSAKNCNDGFGCTADSCNALSGACVHTPNNNVCNDSNPCTDNICTLHSGCQTTSNINPCDDGDACTEDDTCANQVCKGTPVGGCQVCGDGQVQAPEACDDGNATFTNGEYCGVGCVLIPCGKPTNSSGVLPKSSDALYTLKAAVGQAPCSLRVCDVDNSTKLLASDALRVLRSAVGLPVALNCPTSGS